MRALILDVELSRAGGLYGLAALGPEGQERVGVGAAESRRVLREIADWPAEVLVGHNLLAHDRPWLAKEAPDHPALRLPWVDTLLLSPLAFPARPYHRLVKEERLVRESQPAPLADCRATRTLLDDEIAAFGRMEPALRGWIRAALAHPAVEGSGPGWVGVVGGPAPRLEDARRDLDTLLAGRVCAEALAALVIPPAEALAFAYLAAWLLVPPGSTLPAWTRARHPQTRAWLARLRGEGCGRCAWCADQTPEAWLGRMFGYPAFRGTPAAANGSSLQRAIVVAGLEGRPLYAVLPTGTGKSLCFQIPAAARHRQKGELSVVISPLQSLMKDQVDQLRARDPHCTTVNGSLTLPERARALDEVRSGETSLLYLSPEQLRNGAVRRALAARHIGAWVIDEAHCLTEWGHDFRPDYLYVPRFARELAATHGLPPPPFQCFTGTSQLAVTDAIRTLLRQELGQELLVFDGGAERANLALRVERCPTPDKLPRTLELLEAHLDHGGPGAAIVFCATRRGADVVAERLRREGWGAAAYHAGLDAQERREVQDRFLGRRLQVIAATSAFGMGVDKEDVRLVVHQEVPGSLEAYLQQAGRAGRDGQPATCVLLHEPGDLDTQFRLANTGTLRLGDLKALWRGLRRVPSRREGEVQTRVVTPGELARLDVVAARFDPKDPATETRLTAGLAWLERARLFHRDENRTTVFSGRPRFPTLEAAKERLAKLGLPPAKQALRERLLARLYDAEPDEGFTADELADLDPSEVQPLAAGTRLLGTLQEMVQEGLVDGGVQLSAFLAWGVEHPSDERAEALLGVQTRLLERLSELAPTAALGEPLVASTVALAAELSEPGREVSANTVAGLLRALERDGQGLSDEDASADLRHLGRDRRELRLRRPWPEVVRLGRLRRAAAMRVVGTLMDKARQRGERGSSVLVPFELGELVRALEGDLLLAGKVRAGAALADQSLLLLHDHRVLTLQGGLSVFRRAFTLRREPDAPKTVRKEDVEPLLHHQDQRTLQIHVAGAYATRGAEAMGEAQALARDWFRLPQDHFLERWFPGKKAALARPTSEAAYERIVGRLDLEQRAVVTAPETENQLILAGPGAGKTRVLVHRVAWLVRVRRVRPEGILVVCFTRANALELRRRLRELLDVEAHGVLVNTLHGLALRLVGRGPEGGDFDAVLDEAAAVLRGERPAVAADAEEARERALHGATHLLVDEYQDLDGRQAALVEAIAGRDLREGDARLTRLAVGDDDQAIFGWRGGSPAWLGRFETEWGARRVALRRCYRCAPAVLAAAERVIRPVAGRMKEGVTLLPVRGDEGVAVRRWEVGPGELGPAVAALLEGAEPDLAVLARSRGVLAEVRATLEAQGRPVSWPLPYAQGLPLARVREVARVIERLRALGAEEPGPAGFDALLPADGGPWTELLGRWREELRHGEGDRVSAAVALRELWELLASERGDRRVGSGVRLGTLHGAKGLEWDRVILVDDGRAEETDEDRRLWYVGITRAKRAVDLVVPRHGASRLFDGVGVPQPPLAVTPRRGRVHYQMLGLDAIWLDGLARDAEAPGHAVLERLPVGARVSLACGGPRGSLHAEGAQLAWLTHEATAAWRERRAELRLVAVIQRRAEDVGPEWRDRLGCARWWVPICEGRWEE